MATAEVGAMAPVMAVALVGALGVGAQWLAWRLRMPAIVLMLLAGLLVGPVFGILNPSRDIGSFLGPIISIAVAVILFEGGMTLNFHSLKDAAVGVRRLVFLGAPLGWLASAMALHFAAGLSWSTSVVFGGIMIVTGPTVIAPLLRTARLQKRPAALLNWEAIVNDPIGALAAVLAFEYVIVVNTAISVESALMDMVIGIVFASVVGLAAGWSIAKAFTNAWVPEYMKVPMLVATLLFAFGISDNLLHESGLLAVTIMGLYIANADLPSYVELRRFKEHATVLLVSGVFILLAANMSMDTLTSLDWRALVFVLAVVLIARPAVVLLSLAFSNVPWNERLLVAFTGPRGVVLVAVAGLFGERLSDLGIADADRIAPLAFALVASTVILHGFTLAPLARMLGLTASGTPGVLFVGGSQFTAAFAKALKEHDIPVLLTDPNHSHLRNARQDGLETFFGDVLGHAAEDGLDLVAYDKIIAATDNDAYNTLVTTDLAPEYGRENVFQLKRVKQESRRHALPVTLGGKRIAGGLTFYELEARLREGWHFRATNISEEFTQAMWRDRNPDSILLAEINSRGVLRIFDTDMENAKASHDAKIIALAPSSAAG